MGPGQFTTLHNTETHHSGPLPDANLLNYSIWGTLEARACATAHCIVADLKASVEVEWPNVGEDFVREVFRVSLEKVEEKMSGFIENLVIKDLYEA